MWCRGERCIAVLTAMIVYSGAAVIVASEERVCCVGVIPVMCSCELQLW